FSFLRGDINGSIELYRKIVSDLVSVNPLDKTTGFTTINSNVGGIEGKGVDVSINLRKRFGNFIWLWNNSISFVKDWVTDYRGATNTALTYVERAGTSVFPSIGKPLQGVYSFRFYGLDPNTGDPIGILNGVPSKDYPKLIT